MRRISELCACLQICSTETNICYRDGAQLQFIETDKTFSHDMRTSNFNDDDEFTLRRLDWSIVTRETIQMVCYVRFRDFFVGLEHCRV